MPRFFETEFYHPGLDEWLPVMLNVDAIELVRPDHRDPGNCRVFTRDGGASDAGYLVRLTWTEMRCALGAVQK